MDIVAAIFGGLGLFFIGVKLIGANLKQMGGRRLRGLMTRSTRSPWLSGLVGTLAGALTQSTNAVTFIVINLAAAGVVEVRRAVPIIVWANVGTSLLVLMAALDLRLIALFLVGVTGVLYQMEMDKSARFRNAVGALLGIGLLFLGLNLVKAGAAPLRELEIVREFVGFSAESPLIAFLIGALLSLVAQSSSTVSVIAVAMVSVGLLATEQAVMIVYGASLGSGLSVWFMASNLHGTPKRLADLQLFTKLAGVAVLVPLFLVETGLEVPLVMHALRAGFDTLAERIAWLYLVVQVVSAVAVTAVMRLLYAMVERATPPTVEEELSRPHFLFEGALSDPAGVPALVEREHLRLLPFLTEMLDNVRTDTGTEAPHDYRTLHEAGRAVAAEVDGALTDLLAGAPPRDLLERIIHLQNRNEILGGLMDGTRDLVAVIEGLDAPGEGPLESPPDGPLPRFAAGIAESLHALLEELAEEVAEHDPHRRETLLAVTADKSELLDGMRRRLLEKGLERNQQAALYPLTMLFERNVWLLRRYLMLLPDGQALPYRAVDMGELDLRVTS
ncbi:Na/Pi symporter [Azospirillum sp. SYSU D00513]|uniref:Na/Pi symporter n=1 Tax=Azospirillum sp. SYSU D00513 TaxID=2812561 RepID=UPI001A972928|nr:Na/Pi symporter [Azospirillum sp. SYSU D00513]